MLKLQRKLLRQLRFKVRGRPAPSSLLLLKITSLAGYKEKTTNIDICNVRLLDGGGQQIAYSRTSYS